MTEWVKGLSVKSDDVSSSLWPPKWEKKINYGTCPLTSNAVLWQTNTHTQKKNTKRELSGNFSNIEKEYSVEHG